jgi:hypothetical protein
MRGAMNVPTPHPKLLYFAERHSAFDRAQFRDRWRQHAVLGMSLPRWRNIERYAQCDAIGAPRAALPALDCDGVAMVWYRSEAARQAHVSDGAAPIMKRDELETFARPVARCAVLTDEVVFRQGAMARGKLFLAVKRAPLLDRMEFRDRWSGALGTRMADMVRWKDPDAGYVQNHARDRSPEREPMSFDVDCVDEISSDDAGSLLDVIRDEVLHDPTYCATVASMRFVLTEETVLYQAVDQAIPAQV